VTRLHAGPMPFIRYELGDLGAAGSGCACPCGRSLRLLRQIQGRTADFVITPSGNRLIVHFFTGILEHFREIESFQVIQNSADRLLLNIVPGPAYAAETQDKIRRALRDAGADFDIQVKVVENIPLTIGGKRRFIIRNFGPELQAGDNPAVEGNSRWVKPGLVESSSDQEGMINSGAPGH